MRETWIALAHAETRQEFRQVAQVNVQVGIQIAGELWLAPGGLADQYAQAAGISREEALATQAAKVPLGRMVEEEDVAAAVAFLCSERAGSVAGAAWSVDGMSLPTIVLVSVSAVAATPG